jgi:hypothetical protein
MKQTSTTLKGYFNTGDRPTESQFSDFIDSIPADRVYWLSKMGVPDDTDISKDSTTIGTSGTTPVQAVLDNASTGPILVFWDVRTATGKLRIRSNTAIFFLSGCGVKMITNTNNTFIENYNIDLDNDINTKSNPDQNIFICGPGIINQNRVNQTERVGTGTTGTICAMRFYGAKNIRISDIKIYNQCAYSMHFFNSNDFIVSGVDSDYNTPNEIYKDGFHVDSNCQRWVLENSRFRTGDDAIAINANDNFEDATGLTYPYYHNKIVGPIQYGRIQNVLIDDSAQGVRILSGATRVDNIVIDGLQGEVSNWWLIIDNFYQNDGASLSATGDGNVGSIICDNITVHAKGLHPDIPCGVFIGCNVEDLHIRLTRRVTSSETHPTVRLSGKKVKNMSLDIDYVDTNGTNDITQVLFGGNNVVNSLHVSGRFIKTGTANDSLLVGVSAGSTLDYLSISDVETSGHNYIFSNASGSTVKAIQAKGFAHFNAGSGKGAFNTSATVPILNASGGIAEHMTSGSGTFTKTTGDCFASGAEGNGALTFS